MISNIEYARVKDLEDTKEFLTALSRDMTENHDRMGTMYCGLGLVSYFKGVQQKNYCEHKEFNTYFGDYMKQQNEALKKEIEERIYDINLQIGKHIKTSEK
jgi:hypothetical protein